MDSILCKVNRKEPIILVEIEDVILILLDFDQNDGLRM